MKKEVEESLQNEIISLLEQADERQMLLALEFIKRLTAKR